LGAAGVHYDMSLILLLLGCPTPEATFPRRSPPASAPVSSSPPQAQPDWPVLPPSVRIFGLLPPDPDPIGEGFDLGAMAEVLPAHGGYPGVLFLQASSGWQGIPHWQHLPNTFFVPGDLPRGDHSILDVYEGGLDSTATWDWLFPAGDTDRDGYLDVWGGSQLYRGPLLGKTLGRADADAEIDTMWGCGFGDFDADGDGELDVILVTDWQLAVIYHGPFEGLVPSHPENPEVSLFGDTGCGTAAVARLRDHGGPGRDAFAMGMDNWDGGCNPDAYIFELYGPRGRDLYFEDALAVHESRSHTQSFDWAGDLDGDGDGEVMYGADSSKIVYEAPLVSPVEDTPLWLQTPQLSAVGDVNGDGDPDFVVSMLPEEPWAGLLLSPLPPDPDPTQAISIGPYVGLGTSGTSAYGDLDGDGRADLVLQERGAHREGVVSIWFASDLLGESVSPTN
jgi:hypothetical protein